MIGKTLSHYEIVDLLGRGGMGEVYRAHDTRLGRDVAIKLLPEAVADDAERVARFRREARTLASLHHPNVAAIHGLDEADGRLFLVMELVEGEELGVRMARGPLLIEDAIEIATDIARGLEAAHARGIVHRDLKPANVRIASDGTAKILDFGLARAWSGDSVDDTDMATSPTITAAMTEVGTILGTAAYMAPEQARGRSVDHRADVWAFGVLLWEMLNGQRLFVGETTSDVLANVLKQDVTPTDVPAATPPSVRRLLDRCLRRDPRQRLHSMADARIELESDDPVTAGTPGARKLPWQWILTAAVAIAALVLLGRPWADDPIDASRPLAVSINFPEDTPLALIDWSPLAVTPDGNTLAVTARFDGQTGIVVRTLENPDLRLILDRRQAISVFFSPDGRWIGYSSNNRFMKSSVEGGAPTPIVETAHPRGATWGDDGYVYFSPHYSSGVLRVRDTGDAVPETLTVVDVDAGQRTHRWPEALPGGRGVVYTVGVATSPGDYETSEIHVFDARSGDSSALGVRGAIARYAHTGHLVVARDGVLHAVPFDLEALEVRGDPVPVFDGVRGDPASGMYYFALDGASNLFFVAATEGGPRRRLTWIDRNGTIERVDLPLDAYRYPRIDPTGERVVLVLGEGHGNNDDVYLLELDDLSLTRLTFDRTSIMPNWVGDGSALVFNSFDGSSALRLRTMGGQPQVRSVPSSSILLPSRPHVDGRTVLCTRLGASTLGDIVRVDLRDSTRNRTVLETPAAEWSPTLSPDGRWFAYVSDESGREEIYVQPYPPTGAKWQVSDRGGRAPLWSPAGGEIFFVRGDTMYAADITTTPAVRVQTPEELFTHRMDSSGVPIANYDVTSDGQRFLVVEPDASSDSRTVDVRLGWGAVLRDVRP